MKISVLYILLFCFVLQACSPKTPNQGFIPDEIKQKAVDLKANVLQNPLLNNDTVLFLLENIINHYSVYYNQDETGITNVINDTSLTKGMQKEKIKNILNEYYLNSSQISYDVETLDALWVQSYIKSLNDFKNCRWANRIPFVVYKNYLLPYRIENEKISNWKNSLKKDFFKEHDSSFYELEFVEAVQKVHGSLYNRNTGFELDYTRIPNLPLEINYNLQFGSCIELTKKGVSLLRALSIPATIDYVPNFLNHNGGHAWCTAILDEKNSCSFDITSGFQSFKNDNFKVAKVYRRNFALVNNNHFHERGYCAFLPSWLNDPYLVDVTSSFAETTDIKIKVEAASNINYAYLSIFRRNILIPVAFGRIDSMFVGFSSIANGGVYVVQSIEDDKTINLSEPFILDSKGNIKILSPDTNVTIRVSLFRKFPEFEPKKYWRERMKEGKFQGSNDSLFKNSIDLYVVKETPFDFKYHIKVNNDKKFRYLRYYPGKESFGNVAEVEFINDKEELLKGEIIGTEGSWNNDPKRTKYAAFDNNPLTFFDATFADYSWTGIKLATAELVKEIRFLPRSDQNGIIDGQLYELFYWDNGWKSLGKQTGKYRSDNTVPYLEYSNVPSNALLYLRNLTHGIEERIFNIENGKQIWR